MFYKIQGNNKPVRASSGLMFITDNVNGILEAVKSIDSNHIRVFIVDKWQCAFCNVINFNRMNIKGYHQCNYCGRRTDNAKVRY